MKNECWGIIQQSLALFPILQPRKFNGDLTGLTAGVFVMILKEAMEKLYATDFENDEFMDLLGRILFSCTSLTVSEYAEQLAKIYHHQEKWAGSPAAGSTWICSIPF